MKKITILLAALTLGACMADKGNYDYSDAGDQYPVPLTEAGIGGPYDVVQLETIDIDPEFKSATSDDDYDFVRYTKSALDKIDTLGTQRHLQLKVTAKLRAGSYNFYLKVTRRDNQVSRSYSTTVNVVTQFSRGWYITKEVGGMTDLDVVKYDGSEHEVDVIKSVNGASMPGLPIKSALQQPMGSGGYEYESPDFLRSLEPALLVATTTDAWSIMADYMTKYFDTQHLFLDTPTPLKVSDLGSWVSNFLNHSVIINNGKLQVLYGMNGLGVDGTMGQFTEPLFTELTVNPNVAKVDINAYAMNGQNYMLFFDEASHSFFRLAGKQSAPGPYAAVTVQKVAPLTGYDLVYMKEMAQYTGAAGVVKSTSNGKYHFFRTKVSLPGHFFMGNNIPVDFLDPFVAIPDGAVVSTAAVRGVPLSDFATIYSSAGDNQVWAFDATTGLETNILTLPAGEKVAFINNIMGKLTTTEAFNHFVVLSNTDTGWKMRCYDLVNDQLKSTEPVKEYSGTGRAVHALYRGLAPDMTPENSF